MVVISNPLVGDEETIENELLGKRLSREDMSLEQRWAMDAAMKRAAVKKGYDSIVLMAPGAFAKFKSSGKLPRSMELNVLR
jgi:hypothetical protein